MMADQLLENPGFEADWAEEESHRALRFPADGGAPSLIERGSIFTPPGWLTWFRHGLPVEHDPSNPNGWSQPEVRDAWATGDPRRVHSGQKSILLFSFFRIHDGGFLQQVEVEPGTKLRATAWAHAWSNHRGSDPSTYPHPDDPRWSEGEGVGYNHFFALEGQAPAGAAQNFTFWVGIDPTGGQDPYADTVVWGTGAHIYNAHRKLPPAEAVAASDTVTVFLRSRALWPFKHCDAYWDDAKLKVLVEAPQTTISLLPETHQVDQAVEVTVSSNQAHEDVDLVVADPEGEDVPVTELSTTPPPEGGLWRWRFVPSTAGSYDVVFTAAGGDEQPAQTELTVAPASSDEVWGLPREQYARTYVLLPPGAGRAWVEAVLDSGAWDDHRWTIGGSADDAGIGALEDKRVIAVNPAAWGDDLEAFFHEHYPRTEYVPLSVTTPAQLRQRLEEM
jgi:hypothetical protein